MLLSAVTTSHAEKRVALIVGNAAYRHADKLANPVNDAQGMRDQRKGSLAGRLRPQVRQRQGQCVRESVIGFLSKPCGI